MSFTLISWSAWPPLLSSLESQEFLYNIVLQKRKKNDLRMILEADLLSHWGLEGIEGDWGKGTPSFPSPVLRDPWEQVPPSYSPSTTSEFPQSMVTPEEGTEGKACLLKSHHGLWMYLTSGYSQSINYKHRQSYNRTVYLSTYLLANP